jgi:hypothetical protein
MCSGALASAHLCEDNLFDCKFGNIHGQNSTHLAGIKVDGAYTNFHTTTCVFSTR